jgi:hypothetical protein
MNRIAQLSVAAFVADLENSFYFIKLIDHDHIRPRWQPPLLWLSANRPCLDTNPPSSAQRHGPLATNLRLLWGLHLLAVQIPFHRVLPVLPGAPPSKARREVLREKR